MNFFRHAIGSALGLLVLSAPARAAVLTMGAGQAYTTLAQAVAAASAGDTIDVLAGTYTDQTATIGKALTIQGVGGLAVFTQTAGTELANLKGFLIVNADTTLHNLSFNNAAITDANGANAAGIRYQGGNLVVTDSRFIGNQDGILATPVVPGAGTLTVMRSYFDRNGVSSGASAGFTHAIYANDLLNLTVSDSVFQGTQVGHDIKSRARTSVIANNYLDDGITGTTSYALDFSNGGTVTVTGNTIAQGTNTQNWTMLAYGAEGLVYGANALLVRGNSFTNTNPSSIGVNNFTTTVVADVACNSFIGVGTPTLGPAIVSACAVPEPPALAALLAGIAGLWAVRRRDHAPARAG